MSWIIRKLALGVAAGLTLQALSLGAAVASERGGDFVRRELERFLRDRAVSREVVIEIPVLEGFAVESDQGVDELRTEFSTRAEEPFSGRIAVTVELFDRERLLHRGVISTYLRLDEHVFVPVRNLRRGDVLESILGEGPRGKGFRIQHVTSRLEFRCRATSSVLEEKITQLRRWDKLGEHHP